MKYTFKLANGRYFSYVTVTWLCTFTNIITVLLNPWVVCKLQKSCFFFCFVFLTFCSIRIFSLSEAKKCSVPLLFRKNLIVICQIVEFFEKCFKPCCGCCPFQRCLVWVWSLLHQTHCNYLLICSKLSCKCPNHQFPPM